MRNSRHLIIAGLLSTSLVFMTARQDVFAQSLLTDTAAESNSSIDVQPTTNRLMHEINKFPSYQSDSDYLNFSGRKYRKDSVGDFRRTEGMYWQILDVKPIRPNPYRSAPKNSMPLPKKLIDTGAGKVQKSPEKNKGFSNYSKPKIPNSTAPGKTGTTIAQIKSHQRVILYRHLNDYTFFLLNNAACFFYSRK